MMRLRRGVRGMLQMARPDLIGGKYNNNRMMDNRITGLTYCRLKRMRVDEEKKMRKRL
jgi:hypothetical protein